MFNKKLLPRLPGYIALGVMVLFTAFWTYWSMGEMYHEGWWGAWYNRAFYLIPMTICLVLTLIVLTAPRLGGWLLILVGAAFTVWWWGPAFLRGTLTWERVLGQFPMSGLLVIVGILFLLEARYQRQRRAAEYTPPRNWIRRNWRYAVGFGIPLLIIIGVSAYNLPIVLTRVDDGDRGARLIEGNGVKLIWAPEGPGWNWKQPWGGYPSWDSIALYDVPPVGIELKEGYGWKTGTHATAQDMEVTVCSYLSEDGLTLLDEPQHIWRMPTTDELVRSLGRHGENAGCVWNGERAVQAECETLPDKESPLWATDQPVIYYWTADEYNDWCGYFVCYNGGVNATMKSGGNPRHSYRCVREP